MNSDVESVRLCVCVLLWLAVWRSGGVVRRTNDVTLYVEPGYTTGMGDRLRAGVPPRCVTQPSRSTQPCIRPGSLNRVLASIGWGITFAGWQVKHSVTPYGT